MKKKLAPGGSFVGGPGMTPGDVEKRLRKTTGAAATKAEVKKAISDNMAKRRALGASFAKGEAMKKTKNSMGGRKKP